MKMEQDLLEAKNYLSEQGYGSGTNYTTNLVAVENMNMKNLQDYFQVKPFKEQSHIEKYAYILHRVSFAVCILGPFILAYGLGAFSIIFFNWILE